MDPEIRFSLKTARQYAGLTQRQAAKIIGVTAPTMIKYEKGEAKISAENFLKLCDAYGLPAAIIDLPAPEENR